MKNLPKLVAVFAIILFAVVFTGCGGKVEQVPLYSFEVYDGDYPIFIALSEETVSVEGSRTASEMPLSEEIPVIISQIDPDYINIPEDAKLSFYDYSYYDAHDGNVQGKKSDGYLIVAKQGLTGNEGTDVCFMTGVDFKNSTEDNIVNAVISGYYEGVPCIKNLTTFDVIIHYMGDAVMSIKSGTVKN